MTTNDHEPKLSIVVAARNDDHGNGFLQRLTLFIRMLCHQSIQYKFPIEIIIVEWNPLPDNKPLIDSIIWPEKRDYTQIRIITVPPEIHLRFKNSEAIHFFQFIAKNVGIRRSQSPFVLATNADVIFSDELFQFLAQTQFDRNAFYRIDRSDLKEPIPSNFTPEDILRFCRENVFQIFTREGVYLKEDYPHFRLWLWEKFPLGGIAFSFLSFLLNTRKKPHWAKRNREIESTGRIPSIHKLQLIRNAVTHILFPSIPWLHLGASGDFTLMAKEKWVELRGYPELETWPIHIDSLLCMMAYFKGIKENVVMYPKQIFHQFHEGGWGEDSEWSGSLWELEKRTGIPAFTQDDIMKISLEMRSTRKTVPLNPPQWGLAGIELPDYPLPH